MGMIANQMAWDLFCRWREKYRAWKNRIFFRELQAFDAVSPLFEIYRDCMYAPTEENFRKKMEGYFADKQVKIFLCARKKEALGLLVLSFSAPEEAEILGIAVEEFSRRQGIGSFMLRKAKVGRLTAETDDDGVGFYRKNGFAITKFTKDFEGETVTRYHCEWTK